VHRFLSLRLTMENARIGEGGDLRQMRHAHHLPR
jgi:hypothetical protein